MISVTLFKAGQVIVVDANNATEKSILLDLLETFDNNTTIEEIIESFTDNNLYNVIGYDGDSLTIVGSRPGTIKR